MRVIADKMASAVSRGRILLDVIWLACSTQKAADAAAPEGPSRLRLQFGRTSSHLD